MPPPPPITGPPLSGGPPGPPISLVTQALEPGHTLRALLPGGWHPRVCQACQASGILSLGPQRPACWAGCESLELALFPPTKATDVGDAGAEVPSSPQAPSLRRVLRNWTDCITDQAGLETRAWT